MRADLSSEVQWEGRSLKPATLVRFSLRSRRLIASQHSLIQVASVSSTRISRRFSGSTKLRALSITCWLPRVESLTLSFWRHARSIWVPVRAPVILWAKYILSFAFGLEWNSAALCPRVVFTFARVFQSPLLRLPVAPFLSFLLLVSYNFCECPTP